MSPPNKTSRRKKKKTDLTEIDRLTKPDNLFFINANKSYTSDPVPAVIFVFNSTAPPTLKTLRRLETVLIDCNPIGGDDSKVEVEVTVMFQCPQEDGTEFTTATGKTVTPLESVSLKIDFDKEETRSFFDYLDKKGQFLWAVSSTEFSFRSLIDRQSNEIAVTQIETRQLH